MKAVDTSVAVAAFGDWHALNDAATEILDEGAYIPAHCLTEVYSVLTGFPPPHRPAPDLVREWLQHRFLGVLEPPPAADYLSLLSLFAGERRIGGAIYDGLIGLTARLAGAHLVTFDSRATATYALVGAHFEDLSPGN